MKGKKKVIGSIVEIPLGNGKKGVARVYPYQLLLVYKLIFDSSYLITKEDVLGAEMLFIVAVFKNSITGFNLVDFIEITEEEKKSIPPTFWQSGDKYTNCKLAYYQDNSEINVSPEECIGYERAGVFDGLGIIKRTNDQLNGVSKYYGYYDNLVRNTDDRDLKKYDPKNYFNSIE